MIHLAKKRKWTKSLSNDKKMPLTGSITGLMCKSEILYFDLAPPRTKTLPIKSDGGKMGFDRNRCHELSMKLTVVGSKDHSVTATTTETANSITGIYATTTDSTDAYTN